MKIVYTSEDGRAYTKADILFDIYSYLKSRCPFDQSFMKDFGMRYNVYNMLYEHVLGLVTWQHPWTILNEIDQDEWDVIVERVTTNKKRD